MTLWASILMVLAFTAFAAGVAYHLRSESIRAVDRDLNKLGTRLLKDLGQGASPMVDRYAIEELVPGLPVRIWVSILNPDGRRIYQSPGFPKISVQWQRDGEYWDANVAGRKQFRGVDLYGNGYSVRAVASIAQVDEVVSDLLISYALAMPLSLAILSIGGVILARRALAPISRMASTAERITAKNLSERLPAPESRDEISQLTEVLNRMIDRLERGFEQSRRFTANASHQIKTPLTIMRGEVEAMLKSGHADEAALLRVLDEVEDLSAMTDRLLLLSRVDADLLDLRREHVTLASILDGLIEDAGALAEDREISVSADVSADIQISGDVPLLRQIFGNLLDNALKYNRSGGRVTVTARKNGSFADVRVANTGTAIPASKQEALFQRFYRVSSERSGQGLGLNIALEVARAHGGSVQLVRSDADETEFQVKLPLGGS
jgi:signal transduction histidine kinase